jgi:hypothetical protein
MGFFADLANRPDQPVQDVSNAPMTQEQFAQQNPNSSNPDYDYMLYQMQQQNAAKAAADAQLQQTDPNAYYTQKANDLADQIFTSFTNNGHGFGGTSTHEDENRAALENIKQVDPSAYYNAALSLNLKQAGWDAGQGKTNADTNATIQNLAQEATKNGIINQDQFQNLVANNYANTAQWHAQNIAGRQGQGATLQGIEKVAPAFAAMLTAGALAPAAGALEAGSLAAATAPEIAGGSLYTGAGTFAGEGLGTAAELMGPTYGELGVTGLPEGAMGPTYGEMGYTGLNQQAAIDAANAASQGSQALDTLNYANKARNLMGLGTNIGKLLGIGGAASAAGGATGGTASATTGGLSPQQLAKYLYSAAPAQAGPVPYQIKMNQNPFTFNTPGQTQATQGMYDVSGINPMANALRTA